MKRSYFTDLADAEWECLSSHVPAPNNRGRPRIHSSRVILEAIFYVLRSGCPWRLLPREFPPWETVYYWFRRWRIDGTFERLNRALGERLRAQLGRKRQASARIVDPQSAKTSGAGGEHRGYVMAPRRFVGARDTWLVDTEALVLKAKVHSAKVPDQDAIKLVVKTAAREHLRRLSGICGWMQVTRAGARRSGQSRSLG